MKSLWINEKIKYDGEQLHSLYAYLNHRVLGDSIISWVGACDVTFDHMVDGEDLLEKAQIKADKMLHFIIEKFDIKLFSGVCLQRQLGNIFISYIRKNSPVKDISSKLIRCGDDIYFNDKKFNISIATMSPVSCLIHFAVNIDGKNAPVPTLSLQELKLEPKKTANDIMDIFTAEIAHIIKATQKVKWVK